jgi:hypothetical protein
MPAYVKTSAGNVHRSFSVGGCPEFFVTLIALLAIFGCTSHNGIATGVSHPYHPQRGSVPKVAPLFIHGDGKGAIGDFATWESYFLPESLARIIIVDELEAGGIPVDSFDMKIEGIRIYRWRSCCFLGLEPSARQPRFLLDGYCVEDNIGFEYVSLPDFFQLGGEYNGSSYQEYDLFKIAEGVRETLRQHGRISVAVFYDPVVETEIGEWITFTMPGYQIFERASDQLRLQVRDFLIWLENEGLIQRKR